MDWLADKLFGAEDTEKLVSEREVMKFRIQLRQTRAKNAPLIADLRKDEARYRADGIRFKREGLTDKARMAFQAHLIAKANADHLENSTYAMAAMETSLRVGISDKEFSGLQKQAGIAARTTARAIKSTSAKNTSSAMQSSMTMLFDKMKDIRSTADATSAIILNNGAGDGGSGSDGAGGGGETFEAFEALVDDMMVSEMDAEMAGPAADDDANNHLPEWRRMALEAKPPSGADKEEMQRLSELYKLSRAARDPPPPPPAQPKPAEKKVAVADPASSGPVDVDPDS
jgi:hypothetical protein